MLLMRWRLCFLRPPRQCWRFQCGRPRAASSEVRVRFAPSPTGMLHLGGLRTALYNYLFARSHGGKFILRIEDTDQKRIVPGAVEKMMQMLEWAGIHIDEGPFVGGEYGPYVQSDRIEIYKKKVKQLLNTGAAYLCFCSEKRLELLQKDAKRRGEIPRYDNRCRHLHPDLVGEKLLAHTPHVVRFKLTSFKEPWHDLVYGPITYDVAMNEGDPVIMKADGFPTYHLSNVVDDHLMGISHVLRGVEWQVSTSKHLLLYKAFGWEPPAIAHLPLILNKDGTKFSKRRKDTYVEHFKDQGLFPETLINLLTTTGSGFTVSDTSGMDVQQLVQHFDLSHLNRNSTRLDLDRLKPLNREHLRKRLQHPDKKVQLLEEVRGLVKTQFADRLVPSKCLTDEYIQHVLEYSMVDDRIHKPADLVQPEFEYVWTDSSLEAVSEISPEMEAVLLTVFDALHQLPLADFNVDVIPGILRSIEQESLEKNVTYSDYMKMLRSILSGQLRGPSVAEMMTLLGKETTLLRLQTALQLKDIS